MPYAGQVASGDLQCLAWGRGGVPLQVLSSLPAKTLPPRLRAQAAWVRQDTPLAASAGTHFYPRDGSGPALWFFDLRMQTCRAGSALNASTSNTVVSLLCFERIIK